MRYMQYCERCNAYTGGSYFCNNGDRCRAAYFERKVLPDDMHPAEAEAIISDENAELDREWEDEDDLIANLTS